MKVSSIEWLLDNRKYESNDKNVNFDDLPFDGDEMLNKRRQLYGIYDILVFS